MSAAIGAEKSEGHDQICRGWWIFGISLALMLAAIAGWVLFNLEPRRAGEVSWYAWIGPYDTIPAQWVEWILVSLIGSLLYAVASAASWHAKSRPRFIEFTAWYIATIVKGPIIAFAIMLFVTNISVELSGLDLNFTEMKAEVLLGAAFVLGFYSRVAREQLNLIVKGLFGTAYARAMEEFSILPGSAQVAFGKTVQFTTSPLTEVTWLASSGKIEDGLYTAPKSTEAQSGEVVKITAVPSDSRLTRAVAEVTLRPFEIVGPKRIAYGAKENFRVVPEPAGGVKWSASPIVGNAVVDAQGAYHAPSEEQVQEAKASRITITATSKSNPDDFSTLDVYLQ